MVPEAGLAQSLGSIQVSVAAAGPSAAAAAPAS